ncbi:hypothetical protein KIH86_08635 [Paenibacillus sp. HN-1]|uniref:hypothetical protein n=1 Tax=Paenibacillus TaxID=44249 RepID=UPI001CA8F087|nr:MULTISPECIES: hypothetical protein [Paenibacillus]MBY9079617.1 hypothetical protein [Paenibacillus sp. CGMCC 1.18879]MBY9084306.1 hypothetical protein [Paenibacillus sinensis]
MRLSPQANAWTRLGALSASSRSEANAFARESGETAVPREMCKGQSRLLLPRT